MDALSNKNKTSNIPSNQKNIILKIFSEDNIFLNIGENNNQILIDKNGLIEENNKNKNKVTFFGIDPLIEEEIFNNFRNNYFNTNNNNNGKEIKKNYEGILISKKVLNRPVITNKTGFFYIIYDLVKNKYILKSLVKGMFYFALVINHEEGFYFLEEFENNNFIKLGKVVLNISVNNQTKNLTIKICKSKGLFEEQTFYFSKEDIPITIGRNFCTINILHSSVSKVHAFIDYDKLKQKFIIFDNNSTNGTHLILKENKTLVIDRKMIFCLEDKYFTVVEGVSLDN